MKVAIIYNKDFSNVINRFGIQNREIYNEKTVHRVAQALETHGHNVEIIDGNMDVIESLQGFMPKVLDNEKMGMVFNMAYGIQGESRYTHIPSLLEMIGIPYVGSNPSGHALALDKVITKIIMQKHNIPTPDFWVYSSHKEDMSDVKYPVIIKPKMEAVSFGLKVVYNETDLKEAVKFIIEEYQQQALVEQFIRGREFAIGIIGNSPCEAFPVLEIDLNNDPDAIQSTDDKKLTPRKKICPAGIPEELALRMQNESIRAFKALHLKDFSRVDIRLDENGDFYILEINSMASMGPTGSYPIAAKAAGYEYDELVNKMLDVAAKRYFGNKYAAEENEMTAINGKLNRKVKSFLRNNQNHYKQLLKKYVNINTHIRNVDGVDKLSQLIKKQLSEIGFSFQKINQPEIGNLYFYTNSMDDEYDILLLGNIDNLVTTENHHYYKETEQKIYGTGIWQNKGGIVVMLAALQALRSNRLLNKNKIGILLTTDSSIKNKVSAPIIKKKAALAKYVIGMKGAFLDGGLVTSRSGAATYNISMNLINNETENNISKMANIFSKLNTALINLSNDNEGILVTPSSLTFTSNVANTTANGKINLSVRYHDAHQIKDIEAKIFKLINKKHKNLIDGYVNVGNKRPDMKKTEKVAALWKTIKAIADNLDIRLREEHRWSSSDICFAGESKHVIDGTGPVGTMNENHEEYILKYSLTERAALLTLLIHNLEK
ncbi:MAG: M20/M25/M40 family metallo-hydrolase [Fidelibacterota bacterium]